MNTFYPLDFTKTHSYYRFHMELGVWLRIWELENSLDRNGVIAENNKIRERLEEADRELRVQRGMKSSAAGITVDPTAPLSNSS